MAVDGFKPINRRTANSRSSEAAAATLPPAGHARREELKQRKDTLEQAGEEMFRAVEVEAANPDAYTIDRELASHFDELTVSDAQPGYVYIWVNYDTPTNMRGKMVREKLAQRGWEIVTGDDPEARELKDVTGNRRLGDVILMRIKKERYAQLELLEEEKRTRQQRGITSHLEELGMKHRSKGITVHTPDNMDDAYLKRMESGARGAMAARSQLDKNLRDGNIAGL